MINRIKTVAYLPTVGIFSLFLYLLYLMPSDLDDVLYENWICDSFCLVIVLCLLTILILRGLVDIYSPLFFVSIFYILLYFVTPLYDIKKENTSIFGIYDLFNYGVHGSLLALFAYLIFCYFFFLKSKKADNENETIDIYKKNNIKIYNLERFLLNLWILYFFVDLFLVVITRGFSVGYILSFGIFGDGYSSDKITTPLGFIIQLTRGIVPVYLMYFLVSENIMIKFILFLLTSGLETINGFRYMIVILLIGCFFSYYLKRGLKPSVINISIIACVLMLIVSIIGYSRDSVRSGFGFDISGFNFDSIYNIILGNFRIYLSYYAVIKAVPEYTSYLLFDQMFIYTLIMLVPRVIWPGKPDNPGMLALTYGMNETATQSGFAYPALGEFYYSFGDIGAIFFMACFGLWLAWLSNKFRKNAKSLIDLALYCTIVPSTMQLVIRGYTPTNFYFILAMFFPYWIVQSQLSKFYYTESN